MRVKLADLANNGMLHIPTTTSLSHDVDVGPGGFLYHVEIPVALELSYMDSPQLILMVFVLEMRSHLYNSASRLKEHT